MTYGRRWGIEGTLMGVLFICGIMLAWMLLRQNPGCFECYDIHRGIVDGTVDAPYRYRLLSAWMAEAIKPVDSAGGVWFAYSLAHFGVFPLALVLIYRWFRVCAPPALAFGGVMLLAAWLPLGMVPYGVSLYSAVELVIVAWGLSGLRRLERGGWRWGYLALIIAGTLNRETTGVVLVVAYGAWMLPRWRERVVMVWGVMYVAALVGVYGGMRLALGQAELMYPLVDIWQWNTARWWDMTLFMNALTAPIWLLGALGWRHAPAPLKRLLLVMVVYLPPTMVYGVWAETRLQWVVWLIAIPYGLAYLRTGERSFDARLY